MDGQFTLHEQIKAVKREIAMRHSAYPRFVANEKMTQKQADYNIAAMGAVLNTLTSLHDLHEGTLVAMAPQVQGQVKQMEPTTEKGPDDGAANESAEPSATQA